MVTGTLGLERGVSLLDGEDRGRAEGQCQRKVWLFLKFCVRRALSSHASGLQGLFGQGQNSTQNYEFVIPLQKYCGLNRVLWAGLQA